jgi:hypothetical protein
MNVVDLGVSENYGTVCLHASGVERVTAKLDSHHSALDLSRIVYNQRREIEI